MKIVGERLRALRTGLQLSQTQMAEIVGSHQSRVNRFELDQGNPSFEILLRYADFFDVSLDYIFGRTDNPKGTAYDFKPKMEPENKDVRSFIEMCFDPNSPKSSELKEILYRLMTQEKKS